MKLMIASDIHGSAFWCGKLLEAAEAQQPDKLILLGDLLYHGPRNDLPQGYAPEVDQMVLPFPCMADYALLMADGVSFYLTHGHLWNPEKLPPLEPGSVFLSGHTHVKQDVTAKGIRCLNPGSVSIPKDGSHSYLICENGEFRFCTLED